MNKQQLARKIWESANKMRSSIEASEYKDYILGFIFYKFLSEKQILKAKELDATDEDLKNDNNQELIKALKEINGYYINNSDLFSSWIKMGSSFNISNVTEAINHFDESIIDEHKKLYNKIFETLQKGLSKLGDNADKQSKAAMDLIYLIKDIPMDQKQDYDVLGFIYEYLISQFAANAGKKAGEFYTPHEVSLLMSEIIAYHLRDKKEISIYDPTSGSGSLLINIGKTYQKYNNKDNIKYYAQELKSATYNLTRMNLIMRGITPHNIETRNGDTLSDDWPMFDEEDKARTYRPLFVDAVVSNPPYSQHWEPEGKHDDVRYREYGIAPKTKADYAFLLHDLYHTKNDGIMTVILPHGVLFRGNEEGKIRENLIEKNNIDAIIGLPSNIFFGTGIPTIIMVLKKYKTDNNILFIDASKGFVKEGKSNKLQEKDIKKIVDTYINRETIEKYSRLVSRDEIAKNDYNLNIPRYVDSSEPDEKYDMYATMFGGLPKHEIDELNDYWSVFPLLRESLFLENEIPYLTLKVKNIKQHILESKDIAEYKKKFVKAFEDFGEYLNNQWINNWSSINIHLSIDNISKEIFNRLKNIELIDKYIAYQYLADEYSQISADLEMLQTEGFDTAKKVDPNIVIKKKNNKDTEVQDGWLGRIFPFEIVQNKFFKEKLGLINSYEDRKIEIQNRYQELLDSLSEEQKENDICNEDGTAFKFSNSNLKNKLNYFAQTYDFKKIKNDDIDFFNNEIDKNQNIKDSEEKELIKILNESLILNQEEKLINKNINEVNKELSEDTISKIQNLSEKEIKELLYEKWCVNLLIKLNELPNVIVDNLVSKIKNIHEKYEITYLEIEKEIAETEKKLIPMIDDLDGDEFDMKGLNEFKSFLKGK